MIRPAETQPIAIEIAPRGPATDERFDMRAMWRVAGWGAGAAFALVLVAIVSVSGAGSEKLAASAQPPKATATLAELPVRPVATVAVPPFQNPAETKRLSQEVRTLIADRDRLSDRVANLEQQLDDLTGSIKRLAEIPVESAPAPEATQHMSTQVQPKPAQDAEPPAIHSPLAMLAIATTTAKAWPDQPKPPTEPHEEKLSPVLDKIDAESSTAPDAIKPQTQLQVPMPPVRVAAATRDEPSVIFAIALAGASSLEVARLQWAAVKANFGPTIAALQPRALTERRGSVTPYRLVAGPLPTYAAASRLCARIVAAHAICQPVRYGGDPL